MRNLRGKARGRKYSFGIIFIVERSEIEIWGEIEMSGLTKKWVYSVNVGLFLGKTYSKWHPVWGFHQETRGFTTPRKAGRGKARRTSLACRRSGSAGVQGKSSPKSSLSTACSAKLVILRRLQEVATKTLCLPVASDLPIAADARSKTFSFSPFRFHFWASYEQGLAWDPVGGTLRTVIQRKG